MTLEVVVEVSVDQLGLILEFLNSIGPLLQLFAAVDLNAAKIGQLAQTHPSYVSEISRGGCDGLNAQFPVNPFTIGQRQRHAMLFEKPERALSYPVRVTEFYRKSQIGRQPLEKLGQCAML